MPSATECTLRANMPAATPATMPLTVDPKIIPNISERTAGVNQAVPPSIAPRTAPTNNPKRILFIAPPECLVSRQTGLQVASARGEPHARSNLEFFTTPEPIPLDAIPTFGRREQRGYALANTLPSAGWLLGGGGRSEELVPKDSRDMRKPACRPDSVKCRGPDLRRLHIACL